MNLCLTKLVVSLKEMLLRRIYNKKHPTIFCGMFAAEFSALVTPTGFKPVTF